MSAIFSNVFVIIVLQVVVILFSFFLPEILFRITKKQVAWHVLVASFVMIFSVIFLTLLYSTNISFLRQTPETAAQQPSTPAAPEYTLRIGPLPQQTGAPMDLQLTVFNNGPANEFSCSLDFLDKHSGQPLGDADFELLSEKDMLHLDTGANGICAWNVIFHKSGEYLADAFVQGTGMDPSNHEQIALSIAAEKPKAANVQQSSAPAADGHADAPADATVWVYYTRDDTTDSGLVKQLKARDYAQAVAKGKWKTRSESQFLFHRTPEGNGVAPLRNALGLHDVEVYYFDEKRVGRKIKQTFNDNPELDFLVIAR